MNEIQSINLVNAIRKVARQEPTNNMLFGKVVSVSPLKIDIGNNIVLTKKFLFLGQMCRPHKVTIPHNHKIDNQSTETTSLTTDATVGDATPAVIEPNPHKHTITGQKTEDVHKSGSDYEKSVTIEIEPKLKVGDIVLLFAMNNNQMYYVAERIES